MKYIKERINKLFELITSHWVSDDTVPLWINEINEIRNFCKHENTIISESPIHHIKSKVGIRCSDCYRYLSSATQEEIDEYKRQHK